MCILIVAQPKTTSHHVHMILRNLLCTPSFTRHLGRPSCYILYTEETGGVGVFWHDWASSYSVYDMPQPVIRASLDRGELNTLQSRHAFTTAREIKIQQNASWNKHSVSQWSESVHNTKCPLVGTDIKFWETAHGGVGWGWGWGRGRGGSSHIFQFLRLEFRTLNTGDNTYNQQRWRTNHHTVLIWLREYTAVTQQQNDVQEFGWTATTDAAARSCHATLVRFPARKNVFEVESDTRPFLLRRLTRRLTESTTCIS